MATTFEMATISLLFIFFNSRINGLNRATHFFPNAFKFYNRFCMKKGTVFKLDSEKFVHNWFSFVCSGVVWTFLIFWLLMYIVMILFIVGGLLYTNGCRNLNKGVENIGVRQMHPLPPSSRKIKHMLLNSFMIHLVHLNLNNIIINCQGTWSCICIHFLILFFRSMKLFCRIMALISRTHWITVPVPTFLLNKLLCKCLNCLTFWMTFLTCLSAVVLIYSLFYS